MKKFYALFLVFLLSICLFLTLSVAADDKDDELILAKHQTVTERVLRLEMQLALIQQQFQQRSLELIEARKLKAELEKQVQEIETKKKVTTPPIEEKTTKPPANDVKPQKK